MLPLHIRTILLLSIFSSSASYGQVSIKSPQICHTQEKYLACISDGDFILTFSNAEFMELKTSDSLVKYSNHLKTIIFLSKSFDQSEHFDTISISLLKRSVILKKGNESIIIDSLPKLKDVLHTFGIGNISTNGKIDGLAFSVGATLYKVRISTFFRHWSWDIEVEKGPKRVLIEYNGFKNNCLSKIYVRDENLRYGLVISTSFRTLKKIESLESLYSDTVNMNGVTTRTNIIPLNQRIYFDY